MLLKPERIKNSNSRRRANLSGLVNKDFMVPILDPLDDLVDDICLGPERLKANQSFILARDLNCAGELPELLSKTHPPKLSRLLVMVLSIISCPPPNLITSLTDCCIRCMDRVLFNAENFFTLSMISSGISIRMLTVCTLFGLGHLEAVNEI